MSLRIFEAGIRFSRLLGYFQFPALTMRYQRYSCKSKWRFGAPHVLGPDGEKVFPQDKLSRVPNKDESVPYIVRDEKDAAQHSPEADTGTVSSPG